MDCLSRRGHSRTGLQPAGAGATKRLPLAGDTAEISKTERGAARKQFQMIGLQKDWCREGDLNPQGTKYRRILSPLRLPVPPSRRGWAATRLAHHERAPGRAIQTPPLRWPALAAAGARQPAVAYHSPP